MSRLILLQTNRVSGQFLRCWTQMLYRSRPSRIISTSSCMAILALIDGTYNGDAAFLSGINAKVLPSFLLLPAHSKRDQEFLAERWFILKLEIREVSPVFSLLVFLLMCPKTPIRNPTQINKRPIFKKYFSR